MLIYSNKSNFLKMVSIFIVFLFSFQLIAYSYPEQISNPFIDRFEHGNKLFKYEEYKKARKVLEKITNEFEDNKELLIFKGETFLLLGAIYEKLKKKKSAIKYYCKAKKVLGIGETSNENIIFKNLKYYKKSCDAAVYSQIGKKKGRSFIGTIFGLAVLIGGGYLLWKYVLKEKIEEATTNQRDYTDPSTWDAGFDCYKFVVTWVGKISDLQCSTDCKVIQSWENNHAPSPASSNNWDDTGVFVITSTGTVNTFIATLTFKLKGCNNGKIKNTIYIDGKNVFERTDTFVNGCATPSLDASEISKVILTMSSTGSHTVRHVVDLSVNATTVNSIAIRSEM